MSIDNEAPNDIIDIKRQMAQLIVRELEESVVRALKARAARNGCLPRPTSCDPSRGAAPPLEPLVQEALLATPNVGDDADFVIERDVDRDDGLSP